MAVISTARGDAAFLKGLYATLSIIIPRAVHTTMDMTTEGTGPIPICEKVTNDM